MYNIQISKKLSKNFLPFVAFAFLLHLPVDSSKAQTQTCCECAYYNADDGYEEYGSVLFDGTGTCTNACNNGGYTSLLWQQVVDMSNCANLTPVSGQSASSLHRGRTVPKPVKKM